MPRYCTFFGHRDAPYSIEPLLTATVERLIHEEGVTSFLVGGYGSFDHTAQSVVKKLKLRYSDLELLFVTPYLPVDKRIEGYDDIIFPEGLETVPRRFAIVHRNRRMIDMAEHCIFYVGHSWGGAAQALSYAKSHKDSSCIVNLYNTDMIK